jgi:hypothetical protein
MIRVPTSASRRVRGQVLDQNVIATATLGFGFTEGAKRAGQARRRPGGLHPNTET